MSHNENTITVKYDAILPYVKKAQPLDDERVGYHVGRILRDANEEVFLSFVELICGFICDVDRLEDALAVCEIIALIRNHQRDGAVIAAGMH